MIVIALFVIAVATSAPIVAAVLVGVASRREDADWTLGGPAPGLVQAVARRIVDFHSEGVLPRPKGRGPVRSGVHAPGWDAALEPWEDEAEAEAPPLVAQFGRRPRTLRAAGSAPTISREYLPRNSPAAATPLGSLR